MPQRIIDYKSPKTGKTHSFNWGKTEDPTPEDFAGLKKYVDDAEERDSISYDKRSKDISMPPWDGITREEDTSGHGYQSAPPVTQPVRQPVKSPLPDPRMPVSMTMPSPTQRLAQSMSEAAKAAPPYNQPVLPQSGYMPPRPNPAIQDDVISRSGRAIGKFGAQTAGAIGDMGMGMVNSIPAVQDYKYMSASPEERAKMEAQFKEQMSQNAANPISTVAQTVFPEAKGLYDMGKGFGQDIYHGEYPKAAATAIVGGVPLALGARAAMRGGAHPNLSQEALPPSGPAGNPAYRPKLSYGEVDPYIGEVGTNYKPNPLAYGEIDPHTGEVGTKKTPGYNQPSVAPVNPVKVAQENPAFAKAKAQVQAAGDPTGVQRLIADIQEERGISYEEAAKVYEALPDIIKGNTPNAPVPAVPSPQVQQPLRGIPQGKPLAYGEVNPQTGELGTQGNAIPARPNYKPRLAPGEVNVYTGEVGQPQSPPPNPIALSRTGRVNNPIPLAEKPVEIPKKKVEAPQPIVKEEGTFGKNRREVTREDYLPEDSDRLRWHEKNLIQAHKTRNPVNIAKAEQRLDSFKKTLDLYYKEENPVGARSAAQMEGEYDHVTGVNTTPDIWTKYPGITAEEVEAVGSLNKQVGAHRTRKEGMFAKEKQDRLNLLEAHLKEKYIDKREGPAAVPSQEVKQSAPKPSRNLRTAFGEVDTATGEILESGKVPDVEPVVPKVETQTTPPVEIPKPTIRERTNLAILEERLKKAQKSDTGVYEATQAVIKYKDELAAKYKIADEVVPSTKEQPALKVDESVVPKEEPVAVVEEVEKPNPNITTVEKPRAVKPARRPPDEIEADLYEKYPGITDAEARAHAAKTARYSITNELSTSERLHGAKYEESLANLEAKYGKGQRKAQPVLTRDERIEKLRSEYPGIKDADINSVLRREADLDAVSKGVDEYTFEDNAKAELVNGLIDDLNERHGKTVGGYPKRAVREIPDDYVEPVSGSDWKELPTDEKPPTATDRSYPDDLPPVDTSVTEPKVSAVERMKGLLSRLARSEREGKLLGGSNTKLGFHQEVQKLIDSLETYTDIDDIRGLLTDVKRSKLATKVERKTAGAFIEELGRKQRELREQNYGGPVPTDLPLKKAEELPPVDTSVVAETKELPKVEPVKATSTAPPYTPPSGGRAASPPRVPVKGVGKHGAPPPPSKPGQGVFSGNPNPPRKRSYKLATIIGDIGDGFRENSKFMGFMKKNPVLKEVMDSFINQRSASKIVGEQARVAFEHIAHHSKSAADWIKFERDVHMGRYPEVRKYFDDLHDEMTKLGIPVEYKKGYIPQMWEQQPGKPSPSKNKTVNQYASFQNQSTYPDYATGIKQGMTPAMSPIEVMEWYAERSNKLIADHTFINQMTEKGYLTTSGKKAPTWQKLDPNLHGFGNQLAHPAVKKVIENYLTDTSGKWWNILDRKFGKIANMTLSAGFPGTPALTYRGQSIARPVGGRAWLDRGMKGQKDALSMGFNVRNSKNYLKANVDKRAAFAKEFGYTDSTVDVSPTPEFFENANNWFTKSVNWGTGKTYKYFEKPLLESYMPAMKFKSTLHHYEKGLSEGMTHKQAGEYGVRMGNEKFGGANLDKLYNNKDFNTAMRLTFLSPSWLRTNLALGKGLAKTAMPLSNKRVGLSATERKHYGAIYGRAAAAYVAANLLQKSLGGKYMWENEPGHKMDIAAGKDSLGRQRHIKLFPTSLDAVEVAANVAGSTMDRIGGNETANPLYDVASYFGNRTSMGVNIGKGILTGQDYMGRPNIIPRFGRYGKPVPASEALSNSFYQALSYGPPQVSAPVTYGTGFLPGVDQRMNAEEMANKLFELGISYGKPTPKGDGMTSSLSGGKGGSLSSGNEPAGYFDWLFGKEKKDNTLRSKKKTEKVW